MHPHFEVKAESEPLCWPGLLGVLWAPFWSGASGEQTLRCRAFKQNSCYGWGDETGVMLEERRGEEEGEEKRREKRDRERERLIVALTGYTPEI